MEKLRAKLLVLSLMAFAVLLIPATARAASKHAAHQNARVTHQKKAVAQHAAKLALRGVAYKKTVGRHYVHRRRRIWRHRVVLPKQPSRDRTEEIQEALARRGYFSGEPNGKWDSSTENSLRRFQAANGLPPTGKLDAPSLQKMGLGSDVAGVSAPRPVPAPGASSGPTAKASPKTPGE